LDLPNTIAILALIIGILAWQFPRSPRERDNVIERVPPRDPDITSAPVGVPETIDIPFPPGLFLYDYEPGVRLTIRDCKPIRVVKSSVITSGVSFLITSLLFYAANPLAGLFLFIALLFAWRRLFRAIRKITMNIEKRLYFVSEGGGSWGGGWPPYIGLSVALEQSTNLWVTSLYLDTICVWSKATEGAEQGREEIKPFVEALQKITALKRSKNVSWLDILKEQLLLL
jgi:hypothetical protein